MKKLIALVCFFCFSGIAGAGFVPVYSDLWEANCDQNIAATQSNVEKLNNLFGENVFELRSMEASTTAPAQTWIGRGEGGSRLVVITNSIANISSEALAEKVCPALGLTTVSVQLPREENAP